MTRRVVILRPEPGNSATAARLSKVGLTPVPIPFFDVHPLVWPVPDPEAFDGLLLTSANAVRHGGAGLAALRSLPVLAVGAATAATAREAGFAVVHCGSTDVADLLHSARGFSRLLWLAGRERTAIEHRALAAVIPVYASEPIALVAADVAALPESVILLHSARAGERLALEARRHGIARAAIRIAAISSKTAAAVGAGWERIAIASAPDDDSLIAAALPLAIDP